MDIKSIPNINAYKKLEQVQAKKLDKQNLKDIKKEEKVKDKQFPRDELTISQLKEKSDQAYNSLRKMVEDLLKKQGISFKHLEKVDGKVIEVDEATRKKAQEMIEGPLSPENISDDIVKFAKAISGGDKSKIDLLRDAFEEGFKQAEEIFGGELPEISYQTRELVMQKFDAWEMEGETSPE